MSEASDNGIDRWGLAACLLVAIVFRSLAVGLHADDLTRDRDAYLGIAQGVAGGQGLCSPGSPAPTAFRPPFYPLLLGGLLVVIPAGVAVAFINGLFGMTTVWATHRIGQRLSLGRTSLVAALLVAVDPLLSRYSAQPMTETVCTGLVALMLLAFVSDEWQRSRREWGAGALFGLLVLCRPTFWPLAGLMVVAWIVKRGRCSDVVAKADSISTGAGITVVADAASVGSDAGSIRHEGPLIDVPVPSVRPAYQCGLPWRMAVGTLLVVAPWVIRNQLIFGTPLLTTTHGGYTLLLANNPVFYDEVVDQRWGTVWSGDSLARWQSELDGRLERDLGPGSSEIERDRRQSVIAREFIAAEPRRFARAVWHRVRSLWSTVPLGDATDGPPRWLIEAVGWYYSVTLLAFAVGMVLVARQPERGRWWMLYALVLTVQAVHLVYWTNARMRAPVTPVVALFAAATLASRAKAASSDSSTTGVGSG